MDSMEAMDMYRESPKKLNYGFFNKGSQKGNQARAHGIESTD